MGAVELKPAKQWYSHHRSSKSCFYHGRHTYVVAKMLPKRHVILLSCFIKLPNKVSTTCCIFFADCRGWCFTGKGGSCCVQRGSIYGAALVTWQVRTQQTVSVEGVLPFLLSSCWNSRSFLKMLKFFKVENEIPVFKWRVLCLLRCVRFVLKQSLHDSIPSF